MEKEYKPTIAELFRSDKVILWGVNTPEDLAQLIARRIEFYAIHPEVNAFANSLIPPESKNVLYSKVYPEIVYYIARDKIKYHKEYSGEIKDLGVKQTETILSPVAVIRSLKEGKQVYGDCDCKTLFLGTMLANKGFPVRLVLARIVKGGESQAELYTPNHIYLEFAYPDKPDKWIPLDASSNRPFGQISPNIIPLKRFYVGRAGFMAEIGQLPARGLPPEFLITAGEFIKSIGVEMKKGQLSKKTEMISKFIEWINYPLTWVLLITLTILIGFEVYKGLTRKEK